MCVIQHCFICRPSDSTVSEDAVIESRTVGTLALTARRSKQSVISHPRVGWISSTNLARSHPPSLSVQCAAGVAYETPCQKGLAYSPEQHVCNYPDSVSYCEKQSEGVVGFKCPGPNELPPNAVARR